MINFYKSVETKKVHNPFFAQHGIKVPFRMLIAGSSSAGKTTFALNILKVVRNTFSHVIVVCKSKSEPLFEMLERKLKDHVTFYEEEVPDLKEFVSEEDEQTLIIFDDMVCADKKTNEKIGEWFIRSRKKGVSCIYISQSYYKTNKLIRQNCSYIALRGISSKRDLTAILREYGLGIDAKKLVEVYKFAVAEPFSFLLIDLDADDSNKFRKNFTVITLEEED
jgi:hypothetical protein